jgi:hypothetical protein
LGDTGAGTTIWICERRALASKLAGALLTGALEFIQNVFVGEIVQAGMCPGMGADLPAPVSQHL